MNLSGMLFAVLLAPCFGPACQYSLNARHAEIVPVCEVGISSHLSEFATAAVGIMVTVPVTRTCSSYARGMLIRSCLTENVGAGILVNVAALAFTFGAGLQCARATGIVVASAATIVGTLSELAWLGWSSRGMWRGGRSATSSAAQVRHPLIAPWR